MRVITNEFLSMNTMIAILSLFSAFDIVEIPLIHKNYKKCQKNSPTKTCTILLPETSAVCITGGGSMMMTTTMVMTIIVLTPPDTTGHRWLQN